MTEYVSSERRGGAGARLPKKSNNHSSLLHLQSSMERLEHFMEEVLKKELSEVMNVRDELYMKASDCHRLVQVLKDVKRSAQGVDELIQERVGDNIHEKEDWCPMSEVHMLSDIGCHFYMPCVLADPTTIHINVGCNVILPMSHEEAGKFLVRKENQLREKAQSKTKEAIRLRYRIRVVMEAITRLYDAQLSAVGETQ